MQHDSDYLKPETFFEALHNNELGAEKYTAKKNFTYYSGTSTNTLSSYLTDFIATHQRIITPFSRTLEGLQYAPNKGFGKTARKRIENTETVMTQLRGYELPAGLIESVHSAAVNHAPSHRELVHAAPSICDAEQMLKQGQQNPEQQAAYRGWYASQVKTLLDRTPEDENVLVIMDANAQTALSKALEKRLRAA